MLGRDIKHITTALDEIFDEEIDDIHLKNVFAVLRSEKGVSPLIREIGHFFAHRKKTRETHLRLLQNL